jgi:hypothetical protein
MSRCDSMSQFSDVGDRRHPTVGTGRWNEFIIKKKMKKTEMRRADGVDSRQFDVVRRRGGTPRATARARAGGLHTR